MSLNDIARSTGFKKPTHRGRRSRGHGMKPMTPMAKAEMHHAAVNEAMASGDHDTAMANSLHLANALMKMRAKPDQDADDTMPLGVPSPTP